MNQSELELELQRIGVQKGDTLFLRISYKSLGGVEGGPSTVIKALRNCIGSEGNLVATAFGRKGMSQVALMRFFKKMKTIHLRLGTTSGITRHSSNRLPPCTCVNTLATCSGSNGNTPIKF